MTQYKHALYFKSKIASPENPRILTCGVILLPNERYVKKHVTPLLLCIKYMKQNLDYRRI